MSEKRTKKGRPTKFDQTLFNIAMNLYKQGKTDREVADICGVHESTINLWKKNNANFFESLKNAKAIANKRVENALYERAIGYSHKETQVKVVSDGKDMGSRIERVNIDKNYPPDTRACEFWLMNRDPKNWKSTQKIEFNNKSNLEEMSDEEIEVQIKELVAIQEGKSGPKE